MRLCCALVLLGVSGALPGQVRPMIYDVGAALGALEKKVGGVPGSVQPYERLTRLFSQVQGQQKLGHVVGRGVAPNQQVVACDKETQDLLQSVLDEMGREPLPRFHLTCTVLVMPWETAAPHGLSWKEVQEADGSSMTRLMRDVVQQKGTLLNLPETIATPFVPFVAEPRIGVEGKPPPDGAESFRLRGEALAVSPEEALFYVQLVRGSLPEDRTVVPKAPVLWRAFRLRVGNGVTLTAKADKTATVLWLRFTGISTVTPKAEKTDKKTRTASADDAPRRCDDLHGSEPPASAPEFACTIHSTGPTYLPNQE